MWLLSVPIVASRNFLVYANVTYFVCSTIVTMDHTTFLHVLKKSKYSVHNVEKKKTSSWPYEVCCEFRTFKNKKCDIYLWQCSAYYGLFNKHMYIHSYTLFLMRCFIPIGIFVSHNLLFILVGTAWCCGVANFASSSLQGRGKSSWIFIWFGTWNGKKIRRHTSQYEWKSTEITRKCVRSRQPWI